jgi:hypothetical protein
MSKKLNFHGIKRYERDGQISQISMRTSQVLSHAQCNGLFVTARLLFSHNHHTPPDILQSESEDFLEWSL